MHRLAPECKVLALFAFVVAVALTPREAIWAFALYALLIVAMMAIAVVGPGFMGRRLTIEIPFLLFAALLPFMGGGETYTVLGVTLHGEGLWAAWNILAKATLGLAGSILLAATTPASDILHGLQRLRAPKVMIAIAGFMIRYGDVVTGEMKRMTVARVSRGHNPHWLWQARAIAGSVGTLFIRSYERGERVYLAMVSRGYSGGLPSLDQGHASLGQWARTSLVIGAAAAVASAAWLLR